MPRLKKQLTSLEIAQLAEVPGRHAVGSGLYLAVAPKHSPNSCSWLYRYYVNGKAHTMGLGSYPSTKLATARSLAAEFQKQRLLGINPLTQKRALVAEQAAALAQQARDKATRQTFRRAAEIFINGSRWDNAKHTHQWTSTLRTYAYPHIGDLDVKAIETAHVLAVLRQESGDSTFWHDKPETASRVRGRIEKILDAAKVEGFREGENPARWSGHLELMLPSPKSVRAVRHHAALPYSEIPTFMAALREQVGTAARALEFAILTASRTGEVLGAKWNEINLAERMWVVPASRMKAKRIHRVVLSDRALEILRDASPRNDADGYVFPGSKPESPLSNMVFQMLLRRMKVSDVTPHGFRSSFRDWISEKTDFPAEAAEMALAHTLPNKVEAAYRRGDLLDRRRAMAQSWCDYCAGKPTTPPASDDQETEDAA